MKVEIIRMEDMCIGKYEPFALDDFRLNVYEGEVVSLIGLSGAGKTALYHYFLGNAPLVGEEYILEIKNMLKGVFLRGTGCGLPGATKYPDFKT